jgi:hypothetical protein
MDKHKWLSNLLNEEGSLRRHIGSVFHDKVEIETANVCRRRSVTGTKLLCSFRRDIGGEMYVSNTQHY